MATRVTVKMLREENEKLGVEVRRLQLEARAHVHELTSVANVHRATGRLVDMAKEVEAAFHILQKLLTPGLRNLLKGEEEEE